MKLISQIKEIENKILGKISFNEKLSKLSWFNLGGPSKVLFRPQNLQELSIFLKKIKYNFNQTNFSKLIASKSKIQVINIKNQEELKNYFKKNLLDNEMVICMGAGSISNWIRKIGKELK